jgi:hypothetical protein
MQHLSREGILNSSYSFQLPTSTLFSASTDNRCVYSVKGEKLKYLLIVCPQLDMLDVKLI